MSLLLLLRSRSAAPGWGDAWDDITLQVTWAVALAINGGASQAPGLTVSLDCTAVSSAGPPAALRLREAGGAWSAWQSYGRRRTFTFAVYGEHTLEVQYRDEDGNTSPVAAATVEILEPSAVIPTLPAEPAQTAVAGVLAYHGDVLLAELEVEDGSVTADARRAVWRTAELTLTPTETLTHREIYDLLVLPGLELVIRRGWLTPQGEELVVPLGRFVVDEVTLTEGESGTELTATLSDLSTRIQRARWTAPYQVAAGTSLVEALTGILTDRWEAVVLALDASLPNTVEAPVLLEAGSSSDPWADAQNLAQAHGFVLYAAADGAMRLGTPPDASDVRPSRYYHRDERAVVTTVSRSSPLERTYNGVCVSGEGSSLPAPVWGEAWDEDPASPTRVDGPLGRLPYFYSSPLVTTAEQAEAVARALLAKVLGRVETLTWEQIPDPSLQPLEAVEIEDATGALHTYIVDEITFPLAATEAQTATARETRIMADGAHVSDDPEEGGD